MQIFAEMTIVCCFQVSDGICGIAVALFVSTASIKQEEDRARISPNSDRTLIGQIDTGADVMNTRRVVCIS